MLPEEISRCVKTQSAEVFVKAGKRCDDLIEKGRVSIEAYAARSGVALEDVCFVVVGSVGRSEALESSDFDVIPIVRDDAALAGLVEHDQPIRDALRKDLSIKVSKGEDLTKLTTLGQLTERESIGGPNDTSAGLTKRILILTESRQVAGGLAISFDRLRPERNRRSKRQRLHRRRL